MSRLLLGTGAVLGALLLAWGLWLLVAGIADFDSRSEWPRWFAFALSAPVLAVGVWLLVLVRSARRRLRESSRS